MFMFTIDREQLPLLTMSSKITLLLLSCLVFNNVTFVCCRSQQTEVPIQRRESDNIAPSSNRSDTKTYWIKIMLVADEGIKQRFLNAQEAVKFLKTLVVMTNRIYQHGSLSPLDVRVVPLKISWLAKPKVDQLTVKDKEGFVQDEETLKNFCNWITLKRQFQHLPSYDHAIFLLGDETKKIAGITFSGGICRQSHDCSLVLAKRARLFRVAFTLAHEIAHSIGVEHIEVGEDRCRLKTRKSTYDEEANTEENYVIMSHKLSSYWPNKFLWSRCSKQEFDQLLETIPCLSNPPPTNFKNRYALDPPEGRHWTALRQCQLIFGQDYQPNFLFKSLLCRRLCCYNPQKHANLFQCFSKTGYPEGTSCGNDKWCLHGQCIHISKNTTTGADISAESDDTSEQIESNSEFAPVQWFVTSEWGVCSHTCGPYGVRQRRLICGRRGRFQVQSLADSNCATAQYPSYIPQVSCEQESCPLIE